MFVTDFNDLKKRIFDTIKKISDTPIDDSQTSYISQIVNAIAVADDNILFYISMLLNESNINTAILPETIIQVAKVLGVNTATAQPASSIIELHVRIQPDIDSEYIFDSGFTLGSSDNPNIIYIPKRNIHMIYDSVSKKSYVYFDDNNRPISSYIASDANGHVYVVFKADFMQYNKNIIEFYADTDIYEYDIDNPKEHQRYRLDIFVNDVEYNYVSTIYMLRNNSYTYSIYDLKTRLYFATDFAALPISKGSHVVIHSYDTLGSKGNIAANTLIVTNNVSDLISGLTPNIDVFHIDIKNGRDAESLLEFKNKLFVNFLTRNTILSKQYDLNNIGYYLKGISKYNLSVLKKSISPEFTTFVELSLNNKLINTNSVKLIGMSDYIIPQDVVYDNLLDNNTYSTHDSTLVKPLDQINKNPNTCICPFSTKYIPELKLVKYYYIRKRLFVETVPKISLISSYDRLTSVSFDFIDGVYDSDTSKYLFKINLTINTANLHDVDNTDIFNFYITIFNEDSGGAICNKSTELGNVTVGIDKVTNQPYVSFDEFTSLFQQDSKYYINMQCKFRNSTISEYNSYSTIFYSRINITSSVNVLSEFKKYVSPQVLDNSPSYNNADGVDLTPPGLFTKGDIIFYPDKIIVNVYKTSTNASNMSLKSINDVRFKINNVVINTTPTSKTDSTLSFELKYPVNYAKGFYVIEFLLYNDDNTIQYIYHDVDLSQIEGSTNYEIYHVPVIKYDDYLNIIKPNLPDLPYFQINSVYDALADKVIIGINHNVKFVKTFGRIINIKYNKSFRYDPKYIDTIQLPLAIDISLITSNSFDPVNETVNIISTVNDYQNENIAIENNLKSSELESKITSVVHSVYTVKITDPSVDILYDLDDEVRTKNYNEYVPELVTIDSTNISYSKSIS